MNATPRPVTGSRSASIGPPLAPHFMSQPRYFWSNDQTPSKRVVPSQYFSAWTGGSFLPSVPYPKLVTWALWPMALLTPYPPVTSATCWPRAFWFVTRIAKS